ncbi:MAG: hypothetical protein IJP16_07555 [Clostridia bacterium]|nr:hypothetical protein [Clostridia bacterium]
MAEKMWSILIHLNSNMWSSSVKDVNTWDEEMWDYILDECVKTDINTIVLDVGNGIEYASHPEIAVKDAWTRKRVRDEVARCKKLGIALIPKLNFSTNHDMWLGIYSRMVSTPDYYKVANDLIKEVYELFDHPEYIHIGMDEESAQYCSGDLCIFRQGELYWHDLRFLVDCVADTGAMPWAWSNPLFEHPEEYKKRFAPDEMVLSPYHYNALRPDHYTPIDSRSEYQVYYNEGIYKDRGYKYVEEDPFLVHFVEVAIPLMKEGYLYVPCASVFNRCKYNHDDLLEYFRDNAPDEQIVGYMTAPWFMTVPEKKEYFEETFAAYREARDKFYK